MRIRIVTLVAVVVAALGLAAAPTSATLVGEGSITGRVLGPDGRPLTSGAAVMVFRLSNGTWYSWDANPWTDGRFTVDNLEPGHYKLYASATAKSRWASAGEPFDDAAPQWYPGTSDFASATDVVVNADQTTTVPAMNLPRGRHIRGRVVDDTGAPLDNYVDVTAKALGPWGWWDVVTVRADSDGFYDLPQIGNASYVVRTTGGQFTTPREPGSSAYPLIGEFAATYNGGVAEIAAAEPVRVGSSGVLDLPTIRAVRNGRLNGTVLDPTGAPAPGIRVTVPQTTEGNHDLELTTDAQGRWDAGGVRSGTYAIAFRDPGHIFDPVNLGSDSTLDSPGRVAVTNGHATDLSTALEYAAPSVEGRPYLGWGTFVPVGTKLRVKGMGTWTPSSTEVSIQWIRFDDTVIPGATGDTYVVTSADDANTIHARVTATANGRTAHLDTESVEGTSYHFSDNDPTIDDTTPVWGQTLHAAPGRNPDSISSWQWFRSGEEIPGATGSSYVVTSADHGKRLTVAVLKKPWSSWPDPDAHLEIFAVSQPTRAVDEADPTISATARAIGGHKVTLTMRARASRVSSALLDGKVSIGRVRSGSDTIKVATMKDGTLNVTLRSQPGGRRTYYATLHGVVYRFTTAKTSRRTITVR